MKPLRLTRTLDRPTRRCALGSIALAALFAVGCSGSAETGPIDELGRAIDAENRSGTPDTTLGSLALAARTQGLFDEPEITDPGSRADAVAIGDVNADGLADVVVTTTFDFDAENDYQVFIYQQQPDGSLAAPVRVPYRARANRTGLAIAQLDDTPRMEIVVGHAEGITVLSSDAMGNFRSRLVRAPRSAETLSVLDIDLDGMLDIVGLSWSSGATIFYGDGKAAIRQQRDLSTHASGYNDQDAADLNGDGLIDLAVMSGQGYSTPNLSLHLQTGAGQLANPLTYRVAPNENTGGIATGDIDGDGRDDVVLSRSRNAPTHLWVYLQQPDGTLAGPTTLTSHDIPETLEIADLNLDGRNDLLVLHGGWRALGVYMQGESGLAAEQLISIPYASHYSPHGLAVGDIDGDGCPDVALADYNHGLVTLRGQACGSPAPTPAEPLDNIVASASSTYYDLPRYAPQMMLDGNPWTFWVGAYDEAPGPWVVTLDLGQARVATLELDWYARYGASEFDVQLSADGGKTYATIAEGLSTRDASAHDYLMTSAVELGDTNATHVRIVIERAVYAFPILSEARINGWR
jgi:hypothetical protein